MIRRGNRQDLPEVMELMKAAYVEYYESRGLPAYDEDYLARFYIEHIARGNRLALLYELEQESNQKILGILLASANELPFSSAYIAKDSLWWIREDARNFKVATLMVKEYIAWAESIYCDYVGLAHMQDERVAKLYKFLGFEATETVCMRKL